MLLRINAGKISKMTHFIDGVLTLKDHPYVEKDHQIL